MWGNLEEPGSSSPRPGEILDAVNASYLGERIESEGY